MLPQALLDYLGGDPNSDGVEPIGADARLRAYDSAIGDACAAIIAELMRDDESWRSGALERVSTAAAARMQRLHPEFSGVLAAKLGNWYAFQWR